uniref:WAP domain-containing protein n=1 Tax=Nothobranchius furzeri TaxID=105023 RepID=A0A8C6LSS1_NOTFU
MRTHWSTLAALILGEISAFIAFFFPSATPRCPIIPGVMPICGEMCSSDSDCPFGEKCCDNGCGHVCLSHELVKPGSCPIVLFALRCFDHCRGDSSCSNELKCCPTICGFKCVEPIF